MNFDCCGLHVKSHRFCTKFFIHDGHLAKKFAACFTFVLSVSIWKNEIKDTSIRNGFGISIIFRSTHSSIELCTQMHTHTHSLVFSGKDLKICDARWASISESTCRTVQLPIRIDLLFCCYSFIASHHNVNAITFWIEYWFLLFFCWKTSRDVTFLRADSNLTVSNKFFQTVIVAKHHDVQFN